MVGPHARRAGRCLVFGLIAFGAAAAPVDASPCNVLDSAAPAVPDGRAVTARSIAMLRDFGRPDTGSDQGPAFGAAPDGKRVALVVRRADPDHNRFCQALVIVARSGRAALRVIPLDVQPLRQSYVLRGALAASGLVSANPPHWSPDGTRIAILAPAGGTAQIMTISVKDGRTRFLTAAPGGVIGFAWSHDGHTLVYSTRSGLAAFRAATDREALGGYRYDARIVPLKSPRPQPPASLPVTYRAVGRAGDDDRAATAAERRLLVPEPIPEGPTAAIASAAGAAGMRAWLAPADPGNWLSPIEISARVGGRQIPCEEEACSGHLSNLWALGNAFIYFRREGWGSSLTAIYRWRPGSPPERLFATEDVLVGCDIVDVDLLCGREGSLRPRGLWSFDLSTGRQSVIFDPNPGFDRLALPRVERLHWTGPLGAQGYGDLILPSGKPPETGYPAIVVQYRTRGFKRGAIGDEYPILAFAAHGFAVLSLENAPEYASLAHDSTVRTLVEAEHLDTIDDHERRLQLGNLEEFIRTSRTRAPLDSTRLGITGVSDAASSAIFALINTRLFAAASLGSPGLDRTMFAIGGPALRDDFKASGYPMAGAAADSFYRSNALLPNAATIAIPLLLQYPEEEYLGGLTAIAALEDAHAPVDVYVFPDETHVKWQPAHKLAIYRRNLAWFDFWLRGRDDVDNADPAELARWHALRVQLCAKPGTDGTPIQLCSQASTSTSSVTRR